MKKMISDKRVKMLLTQLCRDYSKEYGKSFSQLSNKKFPIISLVLDKYETLLKIHFNESDIGKIAILLLKEMEERNLIHVEGSFFCLTKQGFEKGSITTVHKIRIFLNQNPGISLFLSFLVLIISVIELLK